jgi:hypothetical protein
MERYEFKSIRVRNSYEKEGIKILARQTITALVLVDGEELLVEIEANAIQDLPEKTVVELLEHGTFPSKFKNISVQKRKPLELYEES